jgi:histidine triad (HIT) family protein
MPFTIEEIALVAAVPMASVRFATLTGSHTGVSGTDGLRHRPHLATQHASWMYSVSMDCLFCNIAAGSIPVQKVFEDDTSVAFVDIHPQAPVHLLIIPRKHIASLAHLSPEDERLLGHMHGLAKQIAEQQGLQHGFRTVMNTGPDGGQTVGHLHLHLLGGRPMHWPPG